MLFAISVPTYAINGHISIEYDITNQTYLTEVDLHKEVKPFTIGLIMQTQLHDIILKDGWLPGGIPLNQYYEGYIKYRMGDIKLILKSYCLHYLSQSNIPPSQDFEGITLKAKYEF